MMLNISRPYIAVYRSNNCHSDVANPTDKIKICFYQQADKKRPLLRAAKRTHIGGKKVP